MLGRCIITVMLVGELGMSEDCQTCGTAMYELDEDRNCPGCGDSDMYYNWGEQEWEENRCFYENDLEHLLELPMKEKHR